MAEAPLIVCVDDDPSASQGIQALLTASGFATETFPSAEDFLKFGRLQDASCLVTDVQLDGMSGLELQGRLLESGHTIPVIFVTAFPDERIRDRAMGAGAICFLYKPVTKEELMTCIGAALSRKSPGDGNEQRD